MDSESPYVSYKRYKAKTDAVATWLLTTAKKHGCRAYDSNASSPAVDAATPRLKDFVQLAQHIAKSIKPRIDVPDHIARDLQEAIKRRKTHQALYGRLSHEMNSVEADQGHTYFIQTLETVRELLRPNMPDGFRTKPAQSDVDAKESQLPNIFEHLTVEEPTEADESGTDIRREVATENISVIVTDAVDDEKQEAFIASVYLSRDSHRFLGDLREVWTSYQQGRIDLVAAAIATNTAIEFCRKLDEDFEATFPTQDKAHEADCLYCIHLRATSREERDTKSQEDTCLMNAREILSSLIDAFKGHPSGATVVVPAEHLPPYTGGRDRSAMDMNKRFVQDLDLAMGILPEFVELIQAQPCVQAEHELFRGLRHLDADKKQPFWLTFAFQVYLDIRHILREDVDRGFKDLCRSAQPIAASIDSVLTFNREAGFHTAADRSLKHLSDTIAFWTKHDQVCALIGRRSTTLDRSTMQHIPPNYHLERDPLWCGLLLYNFRMAALQLAIFVAKTSKFILATAHLYTSLRQTKILSCEWPDMERIITMHGAKNIFVGDIPTTFADSKKSFGLAIGMPVSVLAKNHRTRASDHRVSKHRRSLGMLAPTLRRFKTSICDGEGRGAHGPGDIKVYMRQKVLEDAGDECLISAINASDASGILRPLPFLLQSEDCEMTFDHYKMHLVCWQLLREVHVALGKNLEGWSEVHRDDDNYLYGIVMLLLNEWAERDKVAEALGVGGQLDPLHSISKVRELMECLMAREGDVASKGMSDTVAFVPLF